jgi:hypothetical protein
LNLAAVCRTKRQPKMSYSSPDRNKIYPKTSREMLRSTGCEGEESDSVFAHSMYKIVCQHASDQVN